MANWCRNRVTIEGDKQMVELLLSEAQMEKQSFSLVPLVPVVQDNEARIQAWGTKMDLCDVRLEEEEDQAVVLSFSTAWSPPVEAFEVISGNYPQLKFSMLYWESGNDFIGKTILQDGIIYQKDVPYSNQFNCSFEFHMEQGILQEHSFIVPVVVSRKVDPFDLECPFSTFHWRMKLDINKGLQDFDEDIFDDIAFDSKDDHYLADMFNNQRYEIMDEVMKNWSVIQKRIQFLTFHQNLPNPAVNRPSRKI